MATKQSVAERGVQFDVSLREAKTIQAIARRAIIALATAGETGYSLIDAEMDITAVHRNGCPLRLWALLAADDFNFAHDVFGIKRYLDRTTGELTKCFVPRFAEAP